MEQEILPPYLSSSYAGFWLRVIAYFIDAILLNIAIGIVTFGHGGIFMYWHGYSFSAMRASWMPGFWPGVLIVWLYFTLFESSAWQATPGKKALGLAVTDEQGRRIGFGQANIRFWSKILSSIFCIGFLMVAFTARKQGLHDLIARTLVIKR